jgi:hypothetical protein
LNDVPAARPALAEILIGSQLGAIEKIERVRDFVYTVTRDFVRNCQTPILVLPDDMPDAAMELGVDKVLADLTGRARPTPRPRCSSNSTTSPSTPSNRSCRSDARLLRRARL